MKAAIVLLSFLLQATPIEVVVREGESLPAVAARSLGDARGASELKALNGLTSDSVPAGTTLKLPGPDRSLALSALVAARNAVAQADSKAARREEAAAKLKEAEDHFQSANYKEAARAADGAWQLVSASASQPSAFAVEVGERGDTTVTVRSGKPVRVEAEGVTRQVYAGESVRVEKGQPPPSPASPPVAPLPSSPADGKKFTFQPHKGLLGPVTLAWKPVEGVQHYEVEVHKPAGDPLLLRVTTAQATLPTLPAGRYRWTVRALGVDAKSEASATRHFELIDGSLRLDVKSSQWK
jgi:LysM repeat protein